jgi:NAD(P)-dependent dehydrogenase (short-subunit alcohol dehydrogenase family)
MAEAGAHVVGVGRNSERLEAVVAQVREGGGEMTPHIAELADTGTHAGVAEAATAVNGSVDAVVHAAGHFVSTPFAETSEEELEDQWAVHVRAPFLLTQALLPSMSRGSSILFFSSTVASVGFAPYAAYTACKGAVEAMSRSLAIELAPDIRVNTMVPGFTATPMVTDQYVDAPGMEQAIEAKTPVGFVGGPESAAGLAALLASDLGSYVDGARLVVDGGWSAQGWQP